MPYDPNTACDGRPHSYVFLQERPGYLECTHCGSRGIERCVLPDGVNPTEDDIKWLHHGNWPRQDDAERQLTQ